MLDEDGRHSLLERALKTYNSNFLEWRETNVDRLGDDVIATAVDPRLLDDTVTQVDENVMEKIMQHLETVRNVAPLVFLWPFHCSVTPKINTYHSENTIFTAIMCGV